MSKVFLDPNAPNTNAIIGAVLSGGDVMALGRGLADAMDVQRQMNQVQDLAEVHLRSILPESPIDAMCGLAEHETS